MPEYKDKEERVILVDKNDKEVGVEGKIRAHKDGKLHRAFSIFILNLNGQLLLQKRAKSKYHSGGLWANTCCSHPRAGESILKTAHRRLKEEMGFDCDLKEIFSFIYEVKFDNGLFENEYDHVFFGISNQDPDPNPIEVSDWNWMKIEKIEKELTENPGNFTAWFHQCFYQVIKYKLRNKIGVLDDYY